MFSLWFTASDRSPNHPSTVTQFYYLVSVCACVWNVGQLTVWLLLIDHHQRLCLFTMFLSSLWFL